MDLAREFGPMSAMHAALDRAGVGMPCGLVARFAGATTADVEAAVTVAAGCFPVLRSRLAWTASRPTLLPAEPWRATDAAAPRISLAFIPGPDRPPWRYALHGDGDDAWLTAVWGHAVADGRSMLHFLGTVAAAMQNHRPPTRAAERGRAGVRESMATWLPRFLVERHLAYVKPASKVFGAMGVGWLTFPEPAARAALAGARADGVGFSAWLSAAACIAFCEQQRGARAGRVSLDVLVSRGDMAFLGGFGFAAGSLLIPVALAPDMTLTAVARRIGARQRIMLERGWDENLERFIGRDPVRHRLFAALEAKGRAAPMLSVSWKGVYPELGAGGVIGDVACFAASTVAHVSAHVDANGLSISVATRLPGRERDDLLRRIATLIDDRANSRIRSLDELWAGARSASEPSSPCCPKGSSGERDRV